MQTRDQKYALSIYEQVFAIREETFKTSYGSMAHTLPVLIHTSGLAQALAFIASRAKDKGQQQLLDDLSQIVAGMSSEDFLRQARASELREYMYLTECTLAALLWYKRYAQSILGIEAGEGEEYVGEEKGEGNHEE